MNDIERLIALEDIRSVRAKYCRYIDTHEWHRLKDIMTADAVLDLSHTGTVLGVEIRPIKGVHAIAESLAQNCDKLRKLLHIVTTPIIEFENDNVATGIWRQETFIKETRPDLPGTGIAYCSAHDTYQRTDDGWRIASVRITMDIVL